MKHFGPRHQDDALATIVSAFIIGLILGIWTMSGVAPAVMP